MKVSNKIAAFILCIAVLFSLAACTDNSTDTSTVDSYKAAAQKFIDAGDTESAKKALEEGIALTQDESLKTMLEELNPAKPDFSKYVGTWVSSGSSLEVTSNNPEVLNLSFYHPNHDGSRIASIDLSILISSITNNSVTSAFQDSWNTTGSVTITFGNDTITFEIKNVVYANSLFGVPEDAFVFIRHVNLLDNMSPDEKTKLNKFLSNFAEQYFQNFPTGDVASDNLSLAQFAFFHVMVNDSQKIVHSDYGIGIPADSIDDTLNCFFGKTVPHQSIGNFTYSNGAFYTDGIGGGGYTPFSIASEMVKNSDNTFTVDFDVYFDENSDYNTYEKWYSSTPEDAAANYTYDSCGSAVIKEKMYNGQTTYELVSYKLN